MACACWGRLTARERLLIVVVVLSLIAVLVLSVTWYVTQSGEVDVCLTPACVLAASMVISNMDVTVDPCDDFYAFSCGQFLRTTNIPDDKPQVNAFTEVNDALEEQLRVIVEEAESSSDIRPVALVKQVYKSCVNTTRIEARGLEPALDILQELGGWPVLEGDAWNASGFDWETFVYQSKRFGVKTEFFISMSVGPDARNSSYRVITLDVASLGLSRENLINGFDDKTVDAYYQYMVDIAVLFGATKERATRELKEALEFEMTLANISLSSEDRRDASLLYNPMKISELQKRFPSIPWLDYINNLLPVHIDSEEVVVVAERKYIAALESLLTDTEKRVLANYGLWRAAGELVNYLTQAMRDRALQYSTVLTGKLKEDPRWKTCIQFVSKGLSLSLGSLYVTKFFDQNSKKEALDMVNNIKHSFQETLKRVDWMDDGTKERALAKAKTMSAHIAYPDELLDTNKLSEFYAKLSVNEDLYLESVLNITRFETHYFLGLLRNVVNKSDWITHGESTVVNAYYNPAENSIQFPAAILQGAFFNSARPKYMTYGGIGFVIGHEITHGFDDEGRQFDDDGNLVDWWEESTKQKFLERAACIVKQYSNFTDKSTGLNLHGINTQGENIADNGGLKQAYLAYRRWSQGRLEPRLPGLTSWTPRQMFWVSAAQIWCGKYRVEELRQLILTDNHSPEQFRVLGSFVNMAEFAKDFHCPVGSKMNPLNKCHVW